MRGILEGRVWALSWALVVFLVFSAMLALANDRIFFFAMICWGLYMVLYVPVRYRDVRVMPAFELITVLSLPHILFVVAMVFPIMAESAALRVAELLAIYTVGFVLMIHLQRYHGLVLDRTFTVVFMMVFTSALATFFAVGQFLSDQIFGTLLIASNDELMWKLALSMFGGLLASLFLLGYMRRRDVHSLPQPPYQRRGAC